VHEPDVHGELEPVLVPAHRPRRRDGEGPRLGLAEAPHGRRSREPAGRDQQVCGAAEPVAPDQRQLQQDVARDLPHPPDHAGALVDQAEVHPVRHLIHRAEEPGQGLRRVRHGVDALIERLRELRHRDPRARDLSAGPVRSHRADQIRGHLIAFQHPPADQGGQVFVGLPDPGDHPQGPGQPGAALRCAAKARRVGGRGARFGFQVSSRHNHNRDTNN
jgi:hypothetical protein